MLLNYEQAHEYVEINANASWDGWDILVRTPSPGAVFSKQGVQVNNRWYLQQRIPVGEDGHWKIESTRTNRL